MVDAIRRVLRAHPSSSELGDDGDRHQSWARIAIVIRAGRGLRSSSELGEDCDRHQSWARRLRSSSELTLSSTLRLFVSRPTTGEMAPSIRKRRWFSLLPSAIRQMASADFVQIERVPDEAGHQRSSEAIRGHHGQSEIITQRPRGEVNIGDQGGQSWVIRGNYRSLRGHHRPSGGQSWVISGSSHSSPSPS
jgi:hypothetical protein